MDNEEDVKSIDDLDFDSTNDLSQNSGQDQNQSYGDDDEPKTNDAIGDYLKGTLGISNPDKIKFVDDNNEIQEKSWNQLSEQEKLNILKTPNVQQQIVQNVQSDSGLDRGEADFIKFLRQNNISPDEYAESVYNKGAQDANASQPYNFAVDNLTDDELYVSDLQVSTNGQLSDEQLAQKLNDAKQDPDAYAKIVQGIRDRYRGMEQDHIAEQQAEARAQQEAEDQYYENTIIDSIGNLDSIGDLDLDLSNSDREELAEFILGRDGAGNNYFQKALQDPNAQVAAAWFLLHGSQVFQDIEDYVAQQVQTAHANGIQQAVRYYNSKPQPQVTIANRPQQNQPQNVNSIDDINFD